MEGLTHVGNNDSDLLQKQLDWRPVEQAVLKYNRDNGETGRDTDFFEGRIVERVGCRIERMENANFHERKSLLLDRRSVVAESAVNDYESAQGDPVVYNSML